MPFIDEARLAEADQRLLLELARDTIAQYLQTDMHRPANRDDWPATLSRPAACFVTLKIDGQLRGCMGNLEPVKSLVDAVADNAIGAAFRDPRFPELSHWEFEQISLNISVLGAPQPVDFKSCRELETLLNPGEDGLIFEAPGRKGVFLPQVWEILPDPGEFIRQLKIKARLAEEHEPPVLQAHRFQVQYF